MTLKTYVDDIETLEEGIRPFYKEDGERFKLDADFEDVTPLKNALTRQKDMVSGLKNELSVLNQFKPLLEEYEDLDVDSINQFLANGGKADPSEEVEAIKRQMSKKLEAAQLENQTLSQTRDSLEKQIKNSAIDQKARAAALKAGVNPEDVDDVLTLTRRHFDTDDNGKVIVLDEDGDPVGHSPTDFFGKVYKEQKPKFFTATNASGSDAKGGKPDSKGKILTWGEAKTKEQKVEFLKQKRTGNK